MAGSTTGSASGSAPKAPSPLVASPDVVPIVVEPVRRNLKINMPDEFKGDQTKLKSFLT